MLKKHTISIQHAFEGMMWAFRTQPNYRIHLLLSILSLVGCWLLKVSYYEFLIILMLIVIGVMVEAINTAIEATTDAVDKEWREDIKLAKDVSAAAMLIFSFGALIIAGIIFIPKLLALVTF